MRILSAAGVCLSIALCLNVRPAAAENGPRITFDLPYAASMGNSTLPAGSYVITELKDDGGGCVLEISSASGVAVNALFQRMDTPDGMPTGKTHISLRSQSGKYEIDKVWIGGRDYGYESLANLGKH